jgi:hypothetical protein
VISRALFVSSAFGALLAAAPSTPTPAPPSDPKAEEIFSKAKSAWSAQASKLPAFINYGALLRYGYHNHVFDNWWDAYYRSSDGAFALHRLTDEEEDRRRLAGVPFSIFSFKVFDTNPIAEPIRLNEPYISPIDSFGLLARNAPSRGTPGQTNPSPEATLEATPLGTPMRELVVVEAVARDYRIVLAGIEQLQYGEAYHLVLTPLHDPTLYRLRDLWIDTTSYVTLRTSVQGLLDGKPYDAVRWTIAYVPIDGLYYLQQIKSDEPLRFGMETVIPAMEIDFVDYHFPASMPAIEFQHLL